MASYPELSAKGMRDLDGPAHDREMKEQEILAKRSQNYLQGDPENEQEDPGSMPEVRRELIMLKGAMESVWSRWYDLRRKLAPAVPHGQIENDQDRPGMAAPSTLTDVGNAIRSIQYGLNSLEAELSFMESKVQL